MAVRGGQPEERAEARERPARWRAERELRQYADGLAQWWAEHMDAPLRLLGAALSDAPAPLVELGPPTATAAARRAAPDRAPDRVVPFAGLEAAVRELAPALTGPDAELTVVFAEGPMVVAVRLTWPEFRTDLGALLTPEGGRYDVLATDGTALCLERDDDHVRGEPVADPVSVWCGRAGS
ncbi:hypothetical protein ACIRBX_00815 [Kitasatospora sp. NPDC096147]|uniref:hypothetical protein n=1 Tax=Kitasatospora sp. NPDC096147 TaxID=3364093 RepID=UPI0038019946